MLSRAVCTRFMGRSERLDLRNASFLVRLSGVIAIDGSFLGQDGNAFGKLASRQGSDAAGLLSGVRTGSLLARERSGSAVVDVGVGRMSAEFCDSVSGCDSGRETQTNPQPE